MVFKRRDKLTWRAYLLELIYPRGGFSRAARYVMHRMRRLPDTPERIARGIFIGFFIGFLPLPAMQFIAAASLAWLFRGNIFAALLGTFNSNPITTPIFAVFAIKVGHWILGIEAPLSAGAIGHAFVVAGRDLYANFIAIFTPAHMQWDGLLQFWDEIYLPFFIGALIPGFFLSFLAYYITIPIVRTYQKLRASKSAERHEKRGRFRRALDAAKKRRRVNDEGD